MNSMDQDLAYEPIFVARQPIYDRDQHVWGYELLFRHSKDAAVAQVRDGDLATSMVIADGLTLALHGQAPGKKALINFPARLLKENTALALPKDVCVVEILETVQPEKDIISACEHLKEEGYTLALDDFVGQPGFEPFLEMADIVKVEVLGQTYGQIADIADNLMRYRCKLLAEKVEDRETFDLTAKLGFSYFQGFFFSKPEIVPGRKLSAGALAKVQLLSAISRDDCTFDQLTDIIGRDLSLSYRLLKFINSSAFPLLRTVDSISQAIALLGLRPLRQWAMVVAMSDMDPSPKGEELAFTSLQRARFLEQTAKAMPNPPLDPETMFLMGLLSKLDALLNQPMGDILTDMPLQEDVRAALMGEENAAEDWLGLLIGVEIGDWATVIEYMQRYKLKSRDCAVDYLKAAAWARETLGLTKAE